MAEAETSTTETTTETSGADASGTDVDTSTILGGGDTQSSAEGGDTLAGTEGAGTVEGSESDGKVDAPVIPEKYELEAPEGFTLDPALMEAVTPDFKEAGITNDQAQKLLPAAVKFAESLKLQGEQQLIGSVLAERNAWATEARNDKDIGGAKWDETVALSAKALDALPANVGQPLRALLNDSGLGNKREMIAAMSFFGRAIAEDTSTTGSSVSSDKQVPIAHQVFPNNVPKGQ